MEDIKRIEYSGVPWCRAFDTLLIHTSNETLYVEYTFNDYETIWATASGALFTSSSYCYYRYQHIVEEITK